MEIKEPAEAAESHLFTELKDIGLEEYYGVLKKEEYTVWMIGECLRDGTEELFKDFGKHKPLSAAQKQKS
eukprot:TRINITY_DN1348_c0_g1_i2.p1 TRINITY_DN1348_c0_g1~~TRINITY_DN1348_c0_g1_i2.p1  ORF type:complete len:70 (-),score=19.65 TRINITY_DN1348_c0_g1_i2:410-619(-)